MVVYLDTSGYKSECTALFYFVIQIYSAWCFFLQFKLGQFLLILCKLICMYMIFLVSHFGRIVLSKDVCCLCGLVWGVMLGFLGLLK